MKKNKLPFRSGLIIASNRMVHSAINSNIVNPLKKSRDKKYDSQDDYALYKQPLQSSSLILGSGDIAIFFPDDAHMTSIATNSKSIVIKSVVKIPIKIWELKGETL